jgi:hypothetical protein
MCNKALIALLIIINVLAVLRTIQLKRQLENNLSEYKKLRLLSEHQKIIEKPNNLYFQKKLNIYNERLNHEISNSPANFIFIQEGGCQPCIDEFALYLEELLFMHSTISDNCKIIILSRVNSVKDWRYEYFKRWFDFVYVVNLEDFSIEESTLPEGIFFLRINQEKNIVLFREFNASKPTYFTEALMCVD